jgi:hypothetical protein
MDKLVCPSQLTFMQGRNFLYGVVIFHGHVHELQWNKSNDVTLNSDFGKAHHKVKWTFLQQKPCMKGYSRVEKRVNMLE